MILSICFHVFFVLKYWIELGCLLSEYIFWHFTLYSFSHIFQLNRNSYVRRGSSLYVLMGVMDLPKIDSKLSNLSNIQNRHVECHLSKLIWILFSFLIYWFRHLSIFCNYHSLNNVTCNVRLKLHWLGYLLVVVDLTCQLHKM